MSYNIKFDDITSVQVESQKTINAWGEAMSSLKKAMSDFINNQNLQGQAILSMRTYLVEVHGTLLQTLANLMNDYSTNLLLYKDGYYQIDGDLHAKLPGQVFTRLHSDLKGSRDDLKTEIELLKTTKSDISDLVSYEGSSHTSTVMNYNFIMNQLKNLDTSITQYESNHASQDLVAFKELLAATKALITEHAGKTRTVGTYQPGDFAKLKSIQRFAIAYKQATKQMESRVESVKAAQERDKVRFEALARSDKGWGDMAIGAISIIVGVTAIVFTWGTATPLVVATAITAGVGSTAYGVSNMYEASQDIKLGNAGDIQTKAENPIRDTAFMGNDKLYHDVGNVFVTTSAIMIPIGQTQSVVKGVTQFAIGEAGAYTAGQTAYHVTKLAGGSEEDAQTANFIGNLVGGYVTSSAASKFSLNKVKVDVPSAKPSHLDVPLQGKQIPKLDPDSVRFNSRQDLHLKASPADGNLAKLKPHPTVSVDVPNVKQVSGDSATKAVGGIKPSDVDVPKVKGELAQSTHGSATTSIESVTPKELIPGTPEHKAQRWKEYQARDNAGWSYERWSKQYDINMENASYGLSRERKYREVFGGESRVLKTDFTLRQIDIADGTSLKQLKTGKVSLTKQAKIDIQKDAWLIDEGYHVEYILEKGASKPFLNALDENNIPYTISLLLDN